METDIASPTLPALNIAPPPRRREDPAVEMLLSAAGLAGLAAIHLAITWFTWEQPAGRWAWLALSALASFAFVVVVLVRGRGVTRRLVGSALALAAALIGLVDLLVINLVLERTLTLNVGRISLIAEVTGYVSVTLAALAWGIARRRGLLWLVGVPVAPALSWYVGEHLVPRLYESWDRPSFLMAATLTMLWFAVPLAAMVAGWLLDLLQRMLFSSSPR